MIFACAQAHAETDPIVTVTSGKIKGSGGQYIERFLGVPFARPPLGALRWRAPIPLESWAGVRLATGLRAGCVAPESGDGLASNDEDCLYLNVYRPAGTKAGERLPVMVFLHGGGNKWGSPAIYDGERMARASHSVVIIPAYRLGVFGFLAIPGDAAGDGALRDQIAALTWVRNNAEAFGGSPSSITVAGESAGATDVCALLASPLTRGLFSAAIVQSGFCSGNPERPSAEAFGLAVAAKAGCGHEPRKCLRTLAAERVIASWDAVWNSGSLKTPLFPMTPIGTAALPRAPIEAFNAGDRSRVPVLVGFDRDELRSFLWNRYPMTPERFSDVVKRAFGYEAAAVTAEYPLDAATDPLYTLGAIRSDQMIICPSFVTSDALAKHGSVSTFEFADRSAPPFQGLADRHPLPAGFDAGAAHTSELQYLFDYKPVARDLSVGQSDLADRMTRLWIAFGRTPPTQEWRNYTSNNHQTTVIALPAAGGIQVRTDSFDSHHCDFWATHKVEATSLLP